MALRISLVILLVYAGMASALAAEEELGTVTLVACGGLAQSHVLVKWDSGKTNVGAYCPPAGVPIGFAKGDRVKKVDGRLVKVAGAGIPQPSPPKPPAPPPATPPAPTTGKGTVTGITVWVKLEGGQNREIHMTTIPAMNLGDKVEVTGDSLKPAGK